MNYNWSPYAIGGATRADSFSSMTPAMQQGLWALLQAADNDLGQGLQVYSGYRSPELQAQLYQSALKEYGSEKAARKWVAPPGRSRHNSGQAADLKWRGARIDHLPENHPVRAWLTSNVANHGLAQPMAWEPWQVEVAGARGGSMTPQPNPAPQPQEGTSVSLVEGLAELAANSPLFAEMTPQQAAPPLQITPRQVQAYQPTRRDPGRAYHSLFQSLGG